MEATTEPLLQKAYYENCPGCKQDRRNEAHLGIPYREFFITSVITMCYIIPISSTHPYLYFMIRDLHIARREEDIGFYAGFVGASFMIGRLFTSIFWGSVADRYGRKPVVVINMFSIIVFNTLFGLSTSYWMAITSRTLFGVFSGLLGPIKAHASEVCRKEHEALGLSLVVTSLSIGAVIGPAIGGFLAQPAEKYPNIISKESFLGRFPYFLPCFCISLLAVAALMTCFWFPETLHMHNRDNTGGDKIEYLEGSTMVYDGKEDNAENEGRTLVSKRNLIKNWPLISTIIVYSVFALQEVAYAEVFSLWAVSNKRYGGLSFSSQEVGEVVAISGFALLVYQPVIYPCFGKYLGPITSIRVAAILSIPLLTSYTFMSKLSGFSLSLIVNCASFLNNIFTVITMTGMVILQNNAVSQNQRGAANGIIDTVSSFFRAVGPAGGGALFSWAQKRQGSSFLPGDHLVFFALNVVTLIGFMLSFKPFLTQPSIQRA